MKCEICGDNEARKDPELDTITGVQWYMCEDCSRFFAQVEKEMMSIEGGLDFSHDELEEENGNQGSY
jgi:ribosome-binding protein aMBF1 (putative translation factor)